MVVTLITGLSDVLFRLIAVFGMVYSISANNTPIAVCCSAIYMTQYLKAKEP